MNKEKYNQIIEAVGQEYTKWFYDNAVPSVSGKPILNGEGILTRGEFIDKCKTDSKFSEEWGLKIEERELSHDERFELYKKVCGRDLQPHISGINFKQFHFDEFNTPTRLITITYNNETIESYE